MVTLKVSDIALTQTSMNYPAALRSLLGKNVLKRL